MTCTSRAGIVAGSGVFELSVCLSGTCSSGFRLDFWRSTAYCVAVPFFGGMNATMLLIPPTYLNVYSASSRICLRTSVPRAIDGLPVAIEHDVPRPQRVYIMLSDEETGNTWSALPLVPRTA